MVAVRVTPLTWEVAAFCPNSGFPPCDSGNEQRLFFRNILYRLAHNAGWLCSLWGRNWICVYCWYETCVWARTSSCEICGGQNGSGTGFSWVLLFGPVTIILSVFMFTFKAARLRVGRTGEVLCTSNKSNTIPKIGEHKKNFIVSSSLSSSPPPLPPPPPPPPL